MSNADTTETSETDMELDMSVDPIELRKQYKKEMALLTKEVEELKNGTHPEYKIKVNELKAEFKERMKIHQYHQDFVIGKIQQGFIRTVEAAEKQLEKATNDLKETLLADLDEKQMDVEVHHRIMHFCPVRLQLYKDTDVPSRDTNSPSKIYELYPELAIPLANKENSLEMSSFRKRKRTVRTPANESTAHGNAKNVSSRPSIPDLPRAEAYIQDGKLFYNQKCFCRGQSIYVKAYNIPGYAAKITSITRQGIWFKRVSNGQKLNIYTTEFIYGEYIIKHRGS